MVVSNKEYCAFQCQCWIAGCCGIPRTREINAPGTRIGVASYHYPPPVTLTGGVRDWKQRTAFLTLQRLCKALGMPKNKKYISLMVSWKKLELTFLCILRAKQDWSCIQEVTLPYLLCFWIIWIRGVQTVALGPNADLPKPQCGPL